MARVSHACRPRTRLPPAASVGSPRRNTPARRTAPQQSASPARPPAGCRIPVRSSTTPKSPGRAGGSFHVRLLLFPVPAGWVIPRFARFPAAGSRSMCQRHPRSYRRRSARADAPRRVPCRGCRLQRSPGARISAVLFPGLQDQARLTG